MPIIQTHQPHQKFVSCKAYQYKAFWNSCSSFDPIFTHRSWVWWEIMHVNGSICTFPSQLRASLKAERLFTFFLGGRDGQSLDSDPHVPPSSPNHQIVGIPILTNSYFNTCRILKIQRNRQRLLNFFFSFCEPIKQVIGGLAAERLHGEDG